TQLQQMKDGNAAAVTIVRENKIHPRHLRDTESEVVCRFLWQGKLAGEEGFSEIVVGDSEASLTAFTEVTTTAIEQDPNRAVDSLMSLMLHRANYFNRETLPQALVQELDRALSSTVERHLGAQVKVDSIYEAKKRAKKGEGPFAFLDLVEHLGGRETVIAIAKLGSSFPSIFETYEPLREILKSVTEPETYDAIAHVTAFHGTGSSNAFFKKVGEAIEPAFLRRLALEQQTKVANPKDERAQLQRVNNLLMVLRDVGTTRSVPVLQELAKSKNALLRRPLSSAIQHFGGKAVNAKQPEVTKIAAGVRRLQDDIVDLRWASSQQVDVLKVMNLTRHKLSGQWTEKNGILYSPDQRFDRMRMPFVFPEQYDLLIDCKKVAGPGCLVLSLPAATGHRFLVQMNAIRPDYKVNGLEMIDGVGSDKNSTRYDGRFFQTPKRSRVLVSVRRNEISVTIDGKRIIRYTGPQDVLRCRGRGPWHDKEDLVAVLGTYESRFEFHEIVLRSFVDSANSPNSLQMQKSAKGSRHTGFERNSSSLRDQIAGASRLHLDTLTEAAFFVGFGRFGRQGEKGYGRDKRVIVGGKPLQHALSTHPPADGAAHVQYHLDREFKWLTTAPGVTDDGAGGNFQLQFAVYGDGRLLKQSKLKTDTGIVADWKIDVRGVETLLLMVRCGKSNQRAHAIWANPVLEK
ncbi:MAG: NPCBM/NEW2 domain-containing protein, partial [Planctomycetota bacterium]